MTGDPCTVDGCDRPIRARDRCTLHYRHWQQANLHERVPALDRFWLAANPVEEGCWVWSGWFDAYGYGGLAVFGRSTKAHRFAYELLVGPIPDGLSLDHLCRNRGCVNPAHLEPVTRGENVRRGNNPSMVAHRTDTCLRGHSLLDAYVVTKSGGRRCRTCAHLIRAGVQLEPVRKSRAARLAMLPAPEAKADAA